MSGVKGARHYDRAFDHEEARELYEQGHTYRQIAATYGVSISAIKMSVYRHKLRHAEQAPPAAKPKPWRRSSDGHAWARCDRCTTAARILRGETLPRFWAREYTINGARDLCADCQRAKRLMPWLAA